MLAGLTKFPCKRLIQACVAGKDGQLAAGSFDSLSALELTNGLNTMLNLRLPGTLVFDYPSVNAIAGYIHGQLADRGTEAGLPALPAPSLAAIESLSLVVKVSHVIFAYAITTTLQACPCERSNVAHGPK